MEDHDKKKSKMSIFDESSCGSMLFPLSNRCSFLDREATTIMISIGVSFVFFSGMINTH